MSLFLSVLVLLLVSCVPTAWSFSICPNLDLDLYRHRRIEAIRGQILSKLQLSEAPDLDDLPDEVPLEIILLYNSTRDMLRQRVRHRETLCMRSSQMEYYAKDMYRLDMAPASYRESKLKPSLSPSPQLPKESGQTLFIPLPPAPQGVR
ncbi:hypothetical protein chiPu_0031419, partial [Chiloscyllium punctatum]|nr:hypothetical protein [Chiloscyllium punctatum]